MYQSDAQFEGSTAPTLTQVVNQDGTMLNVSTSADPATFGDAVTYTAVVSSTGMLATPTGTVTFLDGTATLGTATLDGMGVATFTTTALTAGTHTVNAQYAGDSGHLPATGSVSQTINTAASASSVSVAATSVTGEVVTLTAKVTGPGGVPTGDVRFLDGAGLLAAVTLDGAGQAVLTRSTFAVGTHAFTVEYTGDANFNASTSPAATHLVGAAATTLALATSSNPAVYGASVDLTATISVTAPGGGVPTGDVAFFEGATSLGVATLDGAGVATLTLSSLSAGVHVVTATFAGDTAYSASTSAAVRQLVTKDGVTSTLASSANPSGYSEPVTLTATVVATSGSVPTGAVTFGDGDSVILGQAALSDAGVATLTTSTLTGGVHTLSVTYLGDSNHEGTSTASLAQTVNVAPTQVATTSSAAPAVSGQAVTYTATVTSAASGVPTGSVVFKEGATTLGTVALIGGHAALTPASVSVGSHVISAVYSGDSNFGASTAPNFNQVVQQANTSVTVSSSLSPAPVGSRVTFIATVSPVAPGAGTPTGTVTFKNGSTVLGTGALAGPGVATFSTSGLTVGDSSITAEYGGDVAFAASNSPSLTQSMSAAAATVAFRTVKSPSTYGSSVSLVAVVSGQGLPPTGSVTFKDGTTTLGMSTLAEGGVAVADVTTLSPGTHSLTAEYGGDPSYPAATATASHVVTKANTLTAVSSSANPSAVGEAVTFTATVTSAVAGLTGQVEFFDGMTSVGKVALANGQAAFSSATLSAGSHVVSATYLGDGNFSTSTSATMTQVVTTTSAGEVDGGVADGGTTGQKPSGGGCGCSSGPSGEWALLAFGLLGAFAMRRRRDARQS